MWITSVLFAFELLRSLLEERSEEGTEGNIFYASGFSFKGSCSCMRLWKLWKVITLWCEI
jgi:hypothetical protein